MIVHKKCDEDEKFKKSYIESMRSPKELLETVFNNLSLKEEPFSILQPASSDDLHH